MSVSQGQIVLEWRPDLGWRDGRKHRRDLWAWPGRPGQRAIVNVRPLYTDLEQKELRGYYWVAYDPSLFIRWKETKDTPVPTLQQAQADALAYVRRRLGKRWEVIGP